MGGDPLLGLAAAAVAIFVAYVRAMAKAAGAPNDFCGPFAKQHRMALVTIIALVKQKQTRTIYFTSVVATIKYVGFSIAIAFLLFRFEYFIYDQLGAFANWIGITFFFVLTGIAGLRMLRASAPLYPSLMMLHLAPSIPAAPRMASTFRRS